MKYAQLVMGSAGTGKSTYCKALQDHCAASGRSVRVINLDPAAETFKYSCSVDIRELISVDDVMTEMGFGPNGALIFCMEYLIDNETWLQEALESFLEDDYILLDCPGQVELYSHVPVMKRVAGMLQRYGFNVCGVYLVDALFVTDASKLIAGNLMALSAMTHFELPHVNVLSKCDLVDKALLDKYLAPSGDTLVSELNAATGPRFASLNVALARILDEFSLVAFIPLDISDEDSLEGLLLQVDQCVQYGEDMEPKEPKEYDGDGDGDGHSHGGAGGAGARGGAGDDDDDGDGDEDALESRLALAARRAAALGDGDGGGGGGGDDGFYGSFAGRSGAGGIGGADGATESYFADTLSGAGAGAGAGRHSDE